MTSKNPLFGAMIAALNDDAPRLVYADSLTEQDDPRGEFIVLQCKLAAGRLGPKEAKAARAREAELLDAHREEWLGPLEKWLRQRDSYSLSHLVLRRGFVASCRLAASEPDDLATLFSKAPLLEGLELRAGKVNPVPQLRQLTWLDVDGMAADSLENGFHDPTVSGRLEKLSVTFTNFRESPALAFDGCTSLRTFSIETRRAKSVVIPNTVESLTWRGPTEPIIPAIPTMPLTTLRLPGADVDAALLEALKPLAPTLETLALDGADFDSPKVLQQLLAMKWPALRSLDLSNVGLGPTGAAAVAKLDAPKLESLDLTYTRIKDEGAVAVLSSPLIKSLKDISLRANRLTEAAVAPVLKAKHSLRLLNLKKNAITPAGLKKLEKLLPDTRLSR